MDKWRRRFFLGIDVKWIRDFLSSSWEYSLQEGKNYSEESYAELDESPLEVWMAALLVGNLSLPIKVPEEEVENILRLLTFGDYA